MGFGQFPGMVCPWAENGALTSYLEDHYESLCDRDPSSSKSRTTLAVGGTIQDKVLVGYQGR